MAELLDNFTADPFAANWENILGTSVHDAGNGEMDVDAGSGDALAKHTAADVGEFDMEAQVTGLASADARLVGPAVRVRDAVDDFYGISLQVGGDWVVYRFNGGTRTLVGNTSVTTTAGNFYTIRLAASGADGANVALSVWVVDHGTSKPADPGWIGDTEDPDFTVTDIEATRLDDSTLHVLCGIGGRTGTLDYDTRHDYWKARGFADRTAAAGLTWLPSTTTVHGPTFKTIASGAIPPLSH